MKGKEYIGFVTETLINSWLNYFDPFGLIMPHEVTHYLSKSGKKIVFSQDEIQNRDTVLCGYWCLYYLIERQKGKSILLIMTIVISYKIILLIIDFWINFISDN